MEQPEPDGEHGAALLLALIAMALIAAVAGSLVVSTSADLLIAGNYRASIETSYAADAAVERATGALAAMADWSAVLSPPPANAIAPFDDGAASARTPDGRILSMPVLSAARQAASAAVYGPAEFGPDSPVWRLFAHAPLARILPSGLVAPPGYVLVWVADDGGDGDGDPSKDANGQLLVYADAYGVSGARRGLEVAIARAAPGGVRILAWKDPR